MKDIILSDDWMNKKFRVSEVTKDFLKSSGIQKSIDGGYFGEVYFQASHRHNANIIIPDLTEIFLRAGFDFLPTCTRIYPHMFADIDYIEEITIPRQYLITDIGMNAFGNSSLKVINLPTTISCINAHAFGPTSTLAIKYEGTVEEWYKINLSYSWYDNIYQIDVECSDYAIVYK